MARPYRTTLPAASARALCVVGALATLAGSTRPAAAQGTTPAAFTYHELAPGVVAAVVNPEAPSYAFANSLIVIGEDGVLVVDTQQNPRPAQEVIAEIRRRTDLPVRWVVNTHWHADHVWGNQVYADTFPGVQFMATAATRDSLLAAWDRQIAEQRERTLGTRGRLREMLAEEADPERRRRIEAAIAIRSRYLDDLHTLRITPPDRIVDGRLHLDIGDRTVALVGVGPAHTPGDLAVWLPDTRILMVGDLLEEGELWLEGADVGGWADALDGLLALDPGTLVMGHGSVQTDLELLRNQLAQLRMLAAEADSGR